MFSGPSVRSVSVTNRPVGGEAPEEAVGLRAGVFKGQALLEGGGIANGTDAPVTTPAELAVPLDARLFLSPAGTGTLIIEDPTGILHPSGKLIGRIAASSDEAGSLSFPANRYAGGEVTQGAAVEVVVEPMQVGYATSGGGLSFELPMRVSGMLMGNRQPFATWRVGLSRDGDLPAGAKVEPLPAPYQPALSPTRGLKPTPWEKSAAMAATPQATSIYGRTDAEKRELLEVWGGGGRGSMEVCNLPSAWSWWAPARCRAHRATSPGPAGRRAPGAPAAPARPASPSPAIRAWRAS